VTRRSALTVQNTPARAPRRAAHILQAIAAFLAIVLPARTAIAHPVPFSYLDLRLSSSEIDGTLVVHIFDAAHELTIEPAERLLDATTAAAQAAVLEQRLTPRLQIAADGGSLTPEWTGVEVLPDRQSIRLHLTYRLARAPGVVAVSAALFPYDPNHQTFLNVYERDALRSQAILDAGRPRFEYFAGTRQGTLAVVQKFVPAGIHHILIGPDHLLFLVGLLLLGGTVRQLAVVVTSFTVAHSVTLSLAALNLVSPPARIIEPAIALSIVYVGADNLLVRNGRDMRAWIAFAFGFIHGFGFASVLREMDLPARALGWSLFSFNFGVEIGQLMVVAFVATAFAALRSRSAVAGQRLAFAGSLVVIAAGAFWFVQRLGF
jgi:hydrogenase/urease accessory protein HupE